LALCGEIVVEELYGDGVVCSCSVERRWTDQDQGRDGKA